MSYQKSIDAVTAAGEHLITRLDDPSIIKQQLEELKELWHNLCQQAVEKEKRLGKAKEVIILQPKAHNHTARILC